MVIGDAAAELTVRSVAYAAEAVQELVAAMDDDMTARYGPGSLDPVDAGGFAPPSGEMLVVHAGGDAVACGGFVRVDDGLAQVHRLFVIPAWRGRSVGRFLLRELEERAWAAGYGTMRLETGVRQPEALGLYRRSGYREIPQFPPHVGDELSVCMAKELVGPACS